MAGESELNRSQPQAMHEPRRLKPVRRHDHPPVRNLNEIAADRLTTGQRVADGVAVTIGSWRFIIIQSVVLATWLALNAIAFFHHWDPYAFILLNLVLSFQAAYAAPIIMMSQNRQAAKDRIAAEHDFQVNVKAEDEVELILQHLNYHEHLLLELVARTQGGPSAEATSPD